MRVKVIPQKYFDPEKVAPESEVYVVDNDAFDNVKHFLPWEAQVAYYDYRESRHVSNMGAAIFIVFGCVTVLRGLGII